MLINPDTVKQLIHGQPGESITIREKRIVRDGKSKTVLQKGLHMCSLLKRVRLESGNALYRMAT